MKRRIFAAVLIGLVIGMSGCGSDGDTYVDPDTQYEVEDDFDSTDEEDIDDDAGFEDEVESGEDEEGTVDPEEIEGIVAMMTHNTTQSCTIEIINIDPNTGDQRLISDFYLERSSDNDEIYKWADTRYNMRGWFSDDFTKMAINKYYSGASSSYGNEDHAGWIDTDGYFTDVTGACMVKEDDGFFDTSLTQHGAIGFNDGQFMFFDTSTGDVYCSTVVDPPEITMGQPSNDGIMNLLNQLTYRRRLTYQISPNACIVDYFETSNSPTSYIIDPATGETTYYIPEADRNNWSGILSPDGDTVAFLSTSKAQGTVQLYTMSMSERNPTAVPLKSSDDTTTDIATIKSRSSMSHPSSCGMKPIFHGADDDVSCCLLEWR